MHRIGATLKGPALGLALLLSAGAVDAGSRYTPPEGCEALATLRLPNCIVRHVSTCGNGNIVDGFVDGRLAGRAYYSHPTLFLRYIGTDGYTAGHRYGPGTPAATAILSAGERYEYSREVYRSTNKVEPGDTGMEVMDVGGVGRIELGGRSYTVRDIKFEVTNERGYRYVERALLLANPSLTIGVTATTYAADGSVEATHNTLPEVISLPGDADFLGFEPAPSCLPSS